MKKVLLLLCLTVSLSSYSRTMVNSWVCDNVKIVMFDDNTCDVGRYTYEAKMDNNILMLHINNKVMLLGNISIDGTLIMYNSDNLIDRKYFVTCD
jgi:hypothetical protein